MVNKRLGKILEEPTSNELYIKNLTTIVKDLCSMKFKRDITLCHGKQEFSHFYNLYLGTNTKKDRSEVPKIERDVIDDANPETLWDLRMYLCDARGNENPDFQIQYTTSKIVKKPRGITGIGIGIETSDSGGYHRLRRIFIQEEDSSTKVVIEINPNGSAEVTFNYHSLSSNKEIKRINKSMKKLIKRGWKDMDDKNFTPSYDHDYCEENERQ